VSTADGFAALQAAFTAHLRDPQAVPAPQGVDPARVAVYARLVFDNVESLLGGCFPVLRSVLADAKWQALVRDFLVGHRARTPRFPELPREFAQYLATGRDGRADPAWLAELADWEWLELEVGQAPEDLPPLSATEVDPLAAAPVLNPLARARAYTHPVHRIAPGWVPAPAPTWLVQFRRRDDSVAFLELNAVSARFVELIVRRPGVPARELFADIARELAHPSPERLVEAGRALVLDLRARELLLLG
jgi:hypothetical protein